MYCNIRPVIFQNQNKNTAFLGPSTLANRTVLFIIKYQHHKSRLRSFQTSRPYCSYFLEMAQTAFRLFAPFFYFDFFQQDSLSKSRESCRKKSNFFGSFCVFWSKQSNFFHLCYIFCPARGGWQSYIAKYP